MQHTFTHISEYKLEVVEPSCPTWWADLTTACKVDALLKGTSVNLDELKSVNITLK